MPTDKRRERIIEHKRQQILLAAARVFARDGYAGASMADLAAEAGYAAPTLYSYFKGKQDIFDALLVEVKCELEALFELWIPEGIALRHRIEMLLRHQMQWIDARRPLLMVLSDQALAPCESGQHKPEKRPEVIVDLWAQWLAQHGDLSELGGRSPRDTAWLLWGITHAFVQRCIAEPDGVELIDRVPEMMELIYFGLPGKPKPGAQGEG